jgi:hypothetical protein
MMADPPDKWKKAKTILEVCREFIIIMAVLFVVLFPNLAKAWMRHMGFDTVTTPIGEINLAAKVQAAGQVQSAKREVSDAAAAVDGLIPTASEANRARLQDLSTRLATTAAQLEAPERVLGAAAKAAVAKAAAASDGEPVVQSREGWMYVGHVDEAKSAWQAPPTIVQAATPAFKAGDAVTITDDVFLRADANGGQRGLAAVVGTLRNGDQAIVLDIGYTHALSGGWFLWLKVKAKASALS